MRPLPEHPGEARPRSGTRARRGIDGALGLPRSGARRFHDRRSLRHGSEPPRVAPVEAFEIPLHVGKASLHAFDPGGAYAQFPDADPDEEGSEDRVGRYVPAHRELPALAPAVAGDRRLDPKHGRVERKSVSAARSPTAMAADGSSTMAPIRGRALWPTPLSARAAAASSISLFASRTSSTPETIGSMIPRSAPSPARSIARSCSRNISRFASEKRMPRTPRKGLLSAAPRPWSSLSPRYRQCEEPPAFPPGWRRRTGRFGTAAPPRGSRSSR